jgi:selenide,water dikinase
MLTSGDKTNRDYVGEDVEIGNSVGQEMRSLLFDPQTAGGMLISIGANRAKALIARLQENYPEARIIGSVTERKQHSIVVK